MGVRKYCCVLKSAYASHFATYSSLKHRIDVVEQTEGGPNIYIYNSWEWWSGGAGLVGVPFSRVPKFECGLLGGRKKE